MEIPMLYTGVNICKMLNIAFHQVLYVNNVYPEKTFLNQHRYNVEIWKCMHPQVLKYIQNFLGIVRGFLEQQIPIKVIFRVKEEETVIEEYVFHIHLKQIQIPTIEMDVSIEHLIKAMRDVLTAPDRPSQSNKDDYNFDLQVGAKPTSFVEDPAGLVGWSLVPKNLPSDYSRVTNLQVLCNSGFVLFADLCER